MANLKTIILFGDSNSGGYAASLADYPIADWTRITGQATAFSSLTKPIDFSIGGINILTPHLPFGSTTTATTSSSTTGTTLDVSGSTPFVASATPTASVLKWVYVRSGTGQGQHRKISAFTDTNTVTISSAWTTNPGAGASVELWNDSYTITGASTATVLTIDNTSGHSLTVNAHVGQWVIIIDPASAIVTQVRKIASNTATTITVTEAFSATPSAGTGIRILTGTNAVNSISDISTSTVEFKPLRFYYDTATSLSTGVDYPNHYTFPLQSATTYNAQPYGGPILELSWRLQQLQGEDIWVIAVSVGGSYLSRKNGGNGLDDFSWFADEQINDWHPASTDRLTTPTTRDLYGYLVEQLIPTADAWVKANRSASDVIDVIAVFANVGAADAANEVRSGIAGSNYKVLRDSIRRDIAAAGFSSINASRIPFIINKITEESIFLPYASTINDQLDTLGLDDPYTGVVDITSCEVGPDTLHFTAEGAIELGALMYEKYLEILKRASSALPESSLLTTLETLRERVRRRYERNDASNDASNDRINGFINDSLREVYNTLGDRAYFLRVVERTTVNYYPTETVLSAMGRRLLRIVDPVNPTTQIPWQFVAHTSNGKMRIVATTGGSLDVHYRIVPQDMTKDGDVAMIPPEHVELVVVMACKRLAESAGNASLSSLLMVEAKVLMTNLKKDCARVERQRQDALESVRPSSARRFWTNENWML